MGYTIIDSLVEEARSELLIPLPGAAFAKSRGSLKKVSVPRLIPSSPSAAGSEIEELSELEVGRGME
jgi:hypothetical protein